MAEAVKAGIKNGGGDATIYQCVHLIDYRCQSVHVSPFRIPETLSADILGKLHAPAKPDYPVITPDMLPDFDAFVLGIPTRYGNFPGQWKVRLP